VARGLALYACPGVILKYCSRSPRVALSAHVSVTVGRDRHGYLTGYAEVSHGVLASVAALHLPHFRRQPPRAVFAEGLLFPLLRDPEGLAGNPRAGSAVSTARRSSRIPSVPDHPTPLPHELGQDGGRQVDLRQCDLLVVAVGAGQIARSKHHGGHPPRCQ